MRTPYWPVDSDTTTLDSTSCTLLFSFFVHVCPHACQQVDCSQEAADIELIVMDCATTFDNINFYFGGEDFALTVSSASGCLAHV